MGPGTFPGSQKHLVISPEEPLVTLDVAQLLLYAQSDVLRKVFHLQEDS